VCEADLAAVGAPTGSLAMGEVDLQNDLNAGNGNLQTLYVRSHLVVVSRAAGLEPPTDSVRPGLDEGGLREQAEFARSLGFIGKSAIHPRQLSILHEVFTPPSGSSAGP
jgi:citrate lyase subunit beta / citryl-CoA lyase